MKTQIYIPFGPWLPDLPQLNNPGSVMVENLLPISAQSYSPMVDFTAFSSPLAVRCNGLFTCIKSDRTAYNFAATPNRIYLLNTVTNAWQDVSASGGYNGDPNANWSGVNYAQTLLFANYSDPVQRYDLIGGSGSCVAMPNTVPKARYLTVIRDFVMMANLLDPTDGACPYRVQWSAIGDALSWPVPGTSAAVAAQSDMQDLLGNGGEIQGIFGNLGAVDGVIVTEHMIYRINYVGPPAIFSFTPVENSRGTSVPSSIVQVGSRVFYLGDDGFYQYEGSEIIPIGHGRIDKTFYQDVDQSQLSQISATSDPINSLVFWSYKSNSSTTGRPDRVLVYNWAITNPDGSVGRWTRSNLDCTFLGRFTSQGAALEKLSQSWTNLDQIPYSFDSRFWQAGKTFLAMMDGSNTLALANKKQAQFQLSTPVVALNNQDFGSVLSARLVCESTGAFKVVANLSSKQHLSDPAIVLTQSGQQGDRLLFPRHMGRYASVRVQINDPAQAISHIMGIELDIAPGGRK